MNLNQLRIFYEVAKLQSFTRAAKKLYLTQSAISHAIKNLEQYLDCTLINRTPKNFRLTDEGYFLYQSCEKAFSIIDNAKEEILHHFQTQQITYTINIGVTVEFGTNVLIKVLKPFIDANHNIKVNIKLSNNLEPLLKEDEVDLIIDCKSYADPFLQKICFLKEEYVLVCSKSFFAKYKIKAIKDLESLPLLSMDEKGLWWNRFLTSLSSSYTLCLNNIIEINHIRGLINAAINSYGIALVPKYAVINELKNKTLIQLFSNIHIKEDSFCIYFKQNKNSFKINKIINYLTQINFKNFGF